MQKPAPFFADPQLQSIYDLFLFGNVVGDYAAGAKAYLQGKERDSGWMDCGRMTAWNAGYDEASKDERYQRLRQIAIGFIGITNEW